MAKTAMKKKPARPRARTARPKIARQMLDQIDRFFVQAHYEERVALWDVLSALRGPDVGNAYLKRYTVRVRRLALPEVANGVDMLPANFCADSAACAKDDIIEEKNASPHFKYHILDAERALGIR